ncbi:hypothetical protein [Lysobacter antibioticus]|uniref:hypothetical protein n=1 Tax=Lysobacter antibioticus TaxID=84531 RepID=UPI0009E79D8B|nr:hypothetical protein [Lysobacter antibioticus]
MKYFVDFQRMPKGALRPLDEGEVVPLKISAGSDPSLLPNVGDYVLIDNSMYRGEGRSSFTGKVRSRLFRYICANEESNCAVTIVVEDTDDDWEKLVKE